VLALPSQLRAGPPAAGSTRSVILAAPRGNDRISQLAQRPDIAGVTRVRAEMAEADRTYAMGLAKGAQASANGVGG